jgi:hypothetical protein
VRRIGLARAESVTVVIGAGPYGLAIAAHLRSLRVATRVFGDPMGSWRHAMPTGMFLKSAPDASNIATPFPGRRLADYCAAAGLVPLEDGEAVPIEVFCGYGLWFADQHKLEIEPSHVTRVARAGNAFDVALDSGEEMRAAAVVIASGHVAHAYTPFALRTGLGTPQADGLLSHAAQHSDLSVFRGRRVAVVGAGQSALESAALLHEAGAVPFLLVRGTTVRWGQAPATNRRHSRLGDAISKPASPLGAGWSLRILADGAPFVRAMPRAMRLAVLNRALGPAGAWWLRARVDGDVETRLGTSIVSAEPISKDTVRLTLRCADTPGDDVCLDVEHVIAATGYHFDVASVGFLDATLRDSIVRTAGYPRLSGSFESSEPGLHFAGLGAAGTFGPLLRFVCGSGLASRRIAHAVASRQPAAMRYLRMKNRPTDGDSRSSAIAGQ